jgi:hypothetical protein
MMEKFLKDKHTETILGICKYLNSSSDFSEISEALISKVFLK